MPKGDDRSVHQEVDPVKKLNYLRPRNPKGKKEAKHPLPNRDTINRQRQEKHLGEFLLDAMEYGYLVEDGDGGTQRVKLDNPSQHLLMELVDNDVVARHMDRKYQATEIKREVVFRDAQGHEVSPTVLRQRIQDDADAEGEYWSDEVEARPAPALSYEQLLLARIRAREQASADAARKAKDEKASSTRKPHAKSVDKLKKEAISFLLDNNRPITVQEVEAYVKAHS